MSGYNATHSPSLEGCQAAYDELKLAARRYLRAEAALKAAWEGRDGTRREQDEFDAADAHLRRLVGVES